MSKSLTICWLICLFAMGHPYGAYSAGSFEGENFNPGKMINHHIKDAHSWEIVHGLVVPLPVILYSEADGLVIFSSGHFFNDTVVSTPEKNAISGGPRPADFPPSCIYLVEERPALFVRSQGYTSALKRSRNGRKRF